MANATDGCVRTERRRLAEDDPCPLRSKASRPDGGAAALREEEGPRGPGGGAEPESSEDELGRLDIDLDRKSRQHNLTSRNVRAILHEVITHERVVAMMKAAIRDTQDLPMFEPKMTRSRLKQAVQQGQPLTWSLSAVNTATVKPPQFVDIELEDDEDSSDEEYCPEDDEEEEDEDDNFTSDADSLASPPKMHQCCQPRGVDSQKTAAPQQVPSGHLVDQVLTPPCAPLHPLSPPESSFLERLNAVEEELDCSPAYTFNQCLDRSAADDDRGSGGLAYRTRSKRPLVDVPLGQLEAELLAPDITADMYEQSTAQWEEDRHWTQWLQSLMAPDNEEEVDDEDDPEYTFVEELDEPDLEDYRTDRAVQITKKEVNELLDELFNTLQEQEEEPEGEEPEEKELEAGPKFNVPPALCFQSPLAGMLTERRRLVRQQYEAQQQKRALQDSTNQHRHPLTPGGDPHTLPGALTSLVVLPNQIHPSLCLGHAQKLQLQQQVQQHVQLLAQVHLLSRRLDALNHEASITKHYLEELQQFAGRREQLGLPSSFRTCNLKGALDLLREAEQRAEPPPPLPAPATSRRWLPRMTPATSSHAFPLLPPDAAWTFATRPVFLYPELLPVCQLDHTRHLRSVYTQGEKGLVVLGLKHFEGALNPLQLISSYLLCKTQWSLRKHIREVGGPRAPRDSMLKAFLSQRVVPPLPMACSSIHPEDQRPPVDRHTANAPNWLKNSRPIIQKTRLDSSRYPASLPPGCSLRLHPHFLSKARPPVPRHRRFFTLANNASLLPLAKAPPSRQVGGVTDVQPISQVAPPPTGVSNHCVSTDAIQACLPIGQVVQTPDSPPVLTPVPPPVPQSATCPIMPCTTVPVNPGCFLLQVMWTPPTVGSQDAVGQQSGHVTAGPRPPLEEEIKEEGSNTPSSLSPLSSSGVGEEGEEKRSIVGVVSLSGGGDPGGEEDDGSGRGQNDRGGGGESGGGREGEAGGEAEDGGEREEDGGGEREEDGGGEREEDGGGDKDEDQDRHGDEEEEEEDFDELTQDEDEEEVMSSASEESVLSVPELQETMKQLTWLAAERQLCPDGDSEEEHSPTSPGSQEEEEEEEEEEGPKEEESGEGRSNKEGRDEEPPSGEEVPRGGGGRCPGRGRGRSRPLRGRSRQERHSRDAAKLLLLYDEHILDNDPQRHRKDTAFAHSYLSRVREALQDLPGQVEDFVLLLGDFERAGEGQEVLLLFRKLCGILGDRTDLLRDFAAFLHPEQALQCGLLEEQQAFERSRRFLRQLEISFGDNPSHYQKIIRALQTGPDLSPASVHELKAQMATLLKGHAHLQAEFWVFFEELRPPPARPGQFEEAHWPEDGGGGSDGGEGTGQPSRGGAFSGFEEVTLPELEEEEEGPKIQPISTRRQRRKMDRNYKGCDWSEKDWCHCHNPKIRRHRRKGCSGCHGNKASGGVSRVVKTQEPVESQLRPEGGAEKDLKDGPHPDHSSASWDATLPLAEEKEEEQEEDDEKRKKRSRTNEEPPTTSPPPTCPPSVTPNSNPPRPSPPVELPVCAKNISLTPSGEKVILWTREADRVILTRCQQDGANQDTFQTVSTLLGNKTCSEVAHRFRDLMRLFRTAARQTGSEDEAPPPETSANEEED
ncbi:GON-4-like protein [Antennarius striatus]|uniref:GON-4-like protein n=1 Tax=Antennarius striatus TaxID=241820 RepID=UPI0035B3753B